MTTPPHSNRRRRWPLGAYFLVLVLVFAAAAAAAAAYVAVQTDRDARRSATGDARFAARTAAQQLAKDVATLRVTVTRLAANPQVAQVFKSPAGCTLSFASGGAVTSGHVDILRPDGSVACSSRAATGGAPLSGYGGQAWLRRASRGPLFLAPAVDSATGQKSVVTSAPIPGGGIVAAFAALDPVGAHLASLYGGGHPLEFVVVDRSNERIVARSIAPSRWIGASIRGTPFATTPQQAERTDVAGKRRLYGAASVAGIPWTLWVGEDKSAALAPGERLRNRQLAIILGGLAVVLIATLVIYRRVAIPIKRLAVAVRSTDPYDLSATAVPEAGPAEVAELGSDINSLVTSVGRELHERQRLEGQLRHSQKMDALGRVAAGVAHDFNNLVTVIAGFTSLIIKSVDDKPQLRAHAEQVGRAAERAAVLIRQLLLFSRKEPTKPTVIPADDLVTGMETMLRRLLGAKIELVARPDAGSASLRGDRGQLEQVLLNLAVNARDAMPDGGRLTLETQTIALDPAAADALVLEPGSWVLLRASDTGTGMDERTKAHLFEPFFTTKPPGEGTGLGLATCWGIVSESGGRIDVESELGRGSVFTVYLPLVDEPSQQPSAPAEPGLAGTEGETILVVEDDAGLRALAKTVLEEAGYTVLDARFGDEALWIADRHEGPINLLLTDGVMPVMSGRELAERLLALHPEAAVVYMSGYQRESFPGSPPPEEAFLAKPFTPETLLTKVRTALR
ncbi:MAG TPA: ATP-binding protein [Gaiellaceae bacterium]